MLTTDPANAVAGLTRQLAASDSVNPGGPHAVDEWADLAQPRRCPVAVADAVGRFLAG